MRQDINLAETMKVAEAHKGWVVSQYSESGRKLDSSVNQTNVRELITRSMESRGANIPIPEIRTETSSRRIKSRGTKIPIPEIRTETSSRRIDPDL